MNVAIILAAGNGTRLSNNIKKQFIKIHDKQLFLFSLKLLLFIKLYPETNNVSILPLEVAGTSVYDI